MKNLVKNNGAFFQSMPTLFDDLFMSDFFNRSTAPWRNSSATLPSVNISETNEDFRIEVAAPGMKREDFKVELDNNTLTISNYQEDQKEEKQPNGNYTRREFSYQSFQRSFSLPENKVEGDKIAAKYSDGILHIVIPKREEAKVKPARQISIS